MRIGEKRNDLSMVYKWVDELATNTSYVYIINNLHLEVLLVMKKSELEKVLNWLLAMGIINAQEYNDLYMKSLPYIK